MPHGPRVLVLDNLSNGSLRNIEERAYKPYSTLSEVDLLDSQRPARTLKSSKIVFHLAANSEVRVGVTKPEVHFQQNILGTHNLLEAVRKAGTVET